MIKAASLAAPFFVLFHGVINRDLRISNPPVGHASAELITQSGLMIRVAFVPARERTHPQVDSISYPQPRSREWNRRVTRAGFSLPIGASKSDRGPAEANTITGQTSTRIG